MKTYREVTPSEGPIGLIYFIIVTTKTLSCPNTIYDKHYYSNYIIELYRFHHGIAPDMVV